jgi:putative peptide zinc metalloprotease protein
LAQAGGGHIALDPSHSNDPRTLETHFEFDIAIEGVRASVVGERVYVRFEHPEEPLATQIGRSLRQMFLHRFAL